MTAILILGACSPGDRFLLYLDPFTVEVLNGQGVDKAAMRQAVPSDLRATIEVAPLPAEAEQAVGRLREVIERTRPGSVYLSAAHPFDPAQVMHRL